MPSLFFDSTETTFYPAVGQHQHQHQIVGGQTATTTATTFVEDQQRAYNLVVEEMSKFGFDVSACGAGGNSVDSRSTCSDPGYPDPMDIMQLAALAQRKSQNTTECVPVPSSEHVAEIVGRQGCKIKALRAKTNTYIKTPVRGEESVFVVTGRKEDVEAAKSEILSAADHFTQIRASRRHSQGGIPAPGHITAYVRVPYKFVGLVVGPKGATIKRIQQQTHTYIITPSRDKEPIFEVTGLSENVETARNEIQMHIVSRTGNFLQLLNGENVVDKDNMTSSSAAAILKEMASMLSATNDFHMNGSADTAYDDLLCDDVGDACCESLNILQQATNAAICKPSSMANQQNSSLLPYFDSTNVDGRNFLSAAKVQNRYSSAWSTNGTMNSSSSDQDEGVWSTGGESPNSMSVEPLLLPSYLGSIWSELDDPKDILLQKRSASISVPEETQGSWVRAVGSQLTASSWSSPSSVHASARRLSSAPVIGGVSGGISLYRQAMENGVGNNFSLTVPMAAAASTAPSSTVALQKVSLCNVCGKEPIEASFEPCGHRCFCKVCATRLRIMTNPQCPICTNPIKNVRCSS